MKFELSEDQALLQQSTQDFLTSEFPLEKSRNVMEHGREGYDPAEWRRLAEMGYLGLTLPASAGGQGLGAVELATVLEQMGRVCAPGPYLDRGDRGDGARRGRRPRKAPHRDRRGQEARDARAPRLALQRASATTPAARFEGGRVRGTKYFVPFAAQADALVVTTPDGVVLVQAPFEVTPLQTFDLSQRFGEVKLDQPGELLGPPSLLDRVDQLAAIGAGAMLLGLMSRSLEMTLEYVQTRQAFKRPIGAFQALQHRLADMLLKTESTRSSVYRAAWCWDTKDPETALA